MTGIARSVVILGVIGTFLGCTDVPKDVPKGLVGVTGKVTYKGAGVPDATVSFVPMMPEKPSSVATTDSSGNYELAMSASAKGAMPGEYRVIVMAVDGVGGMGPKGEVIKPKSLIPEKYNSPDKSGLTATVEEGKSSQSFDFELTD